MSYPCIFQKLLDEISPVRGEPMKLNRTRNNIYKLFTITFNNRDFIPVLMKILTAPNKAFHFNLKARKSMYRTGETSDALTMFISYKPSDTPFIK